MLANGKYSAWFRTPLGEGTGTIVLQDGKVSGGDTVIAYSGSYRQDGDDISAEISTKRHTPGQLSVFGVDEVDIALTGKSTGTMATCRGTSRSAPGVTFEAIVIRMTD
jgi:T3SS negative regulator,GrlR